jgi:Outer membrane lipoprotein virB7
MVAVRLAFTLAILLGIAACSHTMSACYGPAYPLNQGKWTPTEEDLSVRS